MKQKAITVLRFVMYIWNSHKKLILGTIGACILLLIAFVLVCNLAVESDKKYVLPANSTKHTHIGIVLGAGITKQGKPFKELQARLDVAAMELNKGQVDKLILSGDNRFKKYDEPTAMKTYLVNVKHIPANKLQTDHAGRSTYESCERASKVFGVKEAIIYSAGSHLPRAIYLCRHFGITAYGVANNVEANNSTRRELMARVKAILNVYVVGEPTVLGSPIKV
jgi:vancomycin permeability regulator SanA